MKKYLWWFFRQMSPSKGITGILLNSAWCGFVGLAFGSFSRNVIEPTPENYQEFPIFLVIGFMFLAVLVAFAPLIFNAYVEDKEK